MDGIIFILFPFTCYMLQPPAVGCQPMLTTVELGDVTPGKVQELPPKISSKCLVKIVAFYHVFTIYIYIIYIYIYMIYMSNGWLIIYASLHVLIHLFCHLILDFLSLFLSSYIFWQGVQERFHFFPHINVSVHFSLDSGSPFNSTCTEAQFAGRGA